MATYAAAIRRLCDAYTSSPHDRDDLFQEVFLAVWRALPGYRGDASARTWLYRIAHNVAVTSRTRMQRRRSRETPLTDVVEPSTDADLRQLALKQAIARMNPVDRSLTVLWLEGLSAAEIEEVTGMKAGTVAVRLSRIRKQLRPSEVMR